MSGSAQPVGSAPVLDREAFRQVVRVPALRVPKQKCNELLKKLRSFTLDKPKTRCIVPDGERSDTRLLLLSEGLQPEALGGEAAALLESGELEWAAHELELGYGHLSADQVLKRLLPAGMEVPSSFESVGCIAHLNLKEEALPYKHLIGQVILDKNPNISTVVNKLGSIENEFRVFSMEVVAGRGDAAAGLETEVTQHGVRFRLDFTKVYWNSRLEAEHHRLVGCEFRPGQAVADLMAGIGPFALPAALAGCRVYANDLNPDSARYLAANIRANKVGGTVLPFNMDAREFVRTLLDAPGGRAAELRTQAAAAAAAEAAAAGAAPAAGGGPQHARQPQTAAPASAGNGSAVDGTQTREQQQQQQQQHRQPKPSSTKEPPLPAGPPPPTPPGFSVPPGGLVFQHAVMNLPASAVEFLDAFRGAFDPATWAGVPLPRVHCYTFMKGETEQDVIARVEAALGGALDAPPAIHHVRDVAPSKIMLCVSFRVPAAVAFAGRGHHAPPGAAPGVASAVAAAQPPQGEVQQAAKKQRTGGAAS